MEKVGKFKPTCLWHRWNPKERTRRLFQAHCVPGHAFSIIWDMYMEEWWLKQSFDMQCKTLAPATHPSQNPGILLYAVFIYTEKMTKQLLCSHARRKVVHFSSQTEPTGSRGLGLPDKLWARMWSWVLLQTQMWSPCYWPITAWLFQSVMDDLPLLGVSQRRLDTSPKWEVLIWFLEEILHWEVSNTDLTTLITHSGLKK